MSTVQVCENIFVEPRYLDKNLKTYIQSKIVDKYLGKCNQTYGYVLGIDNGSIKIVGNTVSNANENIMFEVVFKIRALKPTKKSRYEGKVCMVFQHGLFVEVEKYMKVLIPTDRVKPYVYTSGKNVFTKGETTLGVGDVVELEIDMVKYEQKNFNCIGNFVRKLA